MDLALAITVIGGFIAISHFLVQVFKNPRIIEKALDELDKKIVVNENRYKDIKDDVDKHELRRIELEQKTHQVETILKKEMESFNREEVTSQIKVILANQKNITDRLDDHHSKFDKLDQKLDKLTELMINYFSESSR